MFVSPIMFLPLVLYQAWLRMVMAPFFDQVEEDAHAATTAVEAMQTKATPV